MWWKDVSRMRQQSENLENPGSFSKSRLKRQVSGEFWDYNISFLNSSRRPFSFKEGRPISQESPICFFPFSDKFLPTFAVAGVLLHRYFGGREPKPNFLTSLLNLSLPLVTQNCLNLSQRVLKLLQTWVEKYSVGECISTQGDKSQHGG